MVLNVANFTSPSPSLSALIIYVRIFEDSNFIVCFNRFKFSFFVASETCILNLYSAPFGIIFTLCAFAEQAVYGRFIFAPISS